MRFRSSSYVEGADDTGSLIAEVTYTRPGRGQKHPLTQRTGGEQQLRPWHWQHSDQVCLMVMIIMIPMGFGIMLLRTKLYWIQYYCDSVKKNRWCFTYLGFTGELHGCCKYVEMIDRVTTVPRCNLLTSGMVLHQYDPKSRFMQDRWKHILHLLLQ